MRLKAPGTASSLLIITVLVLGCLLPFIDKAFHIDDPLFIWCARQIESHPADCYGRKVNWDGHERPMPAAMLNPPLASYYMEPAGALFGWNEVALHAWFLWAALALGIGTYFLARRFCATPLTAALVTVTAPAFLLSSSSVMCDTLMTAFWVWAMVFWLGGLGEGNQAKLCAAALLIAACELTKYFGVSLMALLLVFSLVEKRRVGAWLGWLLAPALVLIIYQKINRGLYGGDFLFNAVTYAVGRRGGGGLMERTATGLAFTGGCILLLLPLAPFLWGRKTLAAGLAAVVMTGFLAVSVPGLNHFSLLENGQIKWLYVVQLSLAIGAGASLIILAAADWFDSKTNLSLLLFCWVSGTFLFASAVNWTVSGRNILPLLPAASILIVRRLERRYGGEFQRIMARLSVPLVCTLAVAMLVSYADYRQANSARAAAAIIMQKTAPGRVWFEGHWGFQYYMEQLGARAIDVDRSRFSPRDAVAVPMGNSYLSPLSPAHFALWFQGQGDALPWLSTMNGAAGAGFYADFDGNLPFAFGAAPPDEYLVFTVH